MNIFDRIREERRAFYDLTGRMATMVYLGQSEWREAKAEHDANRYISAYDLEREPTVIGLELHLTTDDQHCRVGI